MGYFDAQSLQPKYIAKTTWRVCTADENALFDQVWFLKQENACELVVARNKPCENTPRDGNLILRAILNSGL